MQIRKRAPEFKINRSVVDVRKYSAPAIQISHRFIALPSGYESNFTEDLMDDTAAMNILEEEAIQVQKSLKEPYDIEVANNQNESVHLETISLEWNRGYLEIDWTENYTEIDWDIDVSPDIYVEPHEVKIYFQESTKHKFNVKNYTYKGVNLDKKI